MPQTHPQATTAASLRAALVAAAVARAQVGPGLAALILALLVRLFGRTEAALDLSPEYDCAFAFTPTPGAIGMPALGGAPHAACVEAGHVPDWVLAGFRNRSMRPAPRPARLHPRARPARAPPVACSPNR